VAHTSSSVAGRPTGRELIRPLLESGQKQWGSWLFGLAVLIAIVTASSFGAGKSDVSATSAQRWDRAVSIA
jgi:hypothetical protein